MLPLIQRFITNNPDLTDLAVAQYFELDIALVKKARQGMKTL
jgi:hypothetical protein